MAVILNTVILDLDSHVSFIFSQTHSKTLSLHSDSGFKLFAFKIKVHLFILTQPDDGSHLELWHLGFRHCHLGFRHFVQKKLHSFILTHTWWWQPYWILPSSIQPFFRKIMSLIHSDSTWWWQPSWILPCWIQTLPSWIQTPCYLLSDSLKNTLPLLWPWLTLIQSD